MIKQRMVEIARHFHKIIGEQDSSEDCLKLLESHHPPQFQQHLHKLIDYFVAELRQLSLQDNLVGLFDQIIDHNIDGLLAVRKAILQRRLAMDV